MDRKMETRPPALIEGFVRVLTPLVSREHVLGDLSERYVSPGSYIFDALQTIPFVVASRIRRTVDPAFFLAGALATWGLAFKGPIQPTWLGPIIPTLVCSIVLVLRDAYRRPAAKALPVVAVDMIYFVVAAVAAQAILAVVAPQWMLSMDSSWTDFAIGLTLLFFMRLQMPSGLFAPKTHASSLTMSDLTAEIRFYESAIRRAVGIELGVCVFAAVAVAAFGWSEPNGSSLVEKIALAVTLAAVGFVGVFMYRYCRVRSIPIHLGFERAVAAYREDLEYRCRLSATYLWWYLLPLMVGPTMLTIGTVLRVPTPFPVMAVVIAVTVFGMAIVATLLLWFQRRMIRKTRQRINQLSVVTEKI